MSVNYNGSPVRQFTREEAIAFDWQSLTVRERGIVGLYQQLLCMPFDKLHEGVEAALERPVWTHEFAVPDALRAEFEGRADRPTMQEILDKIPAHKRIVIVEGAP